MSFFVFLDLKKKPRVQNVKVQIQYVKGDYKRKKKSTLVK